MSIFDCNWDRVFEGQGNDNLEIARAFLTRISQCSAMDSDVTIPEAIHAIRDEIQRRDETHEITEKVMNFAKKAITGGK